MMGLINFKTMVLGEKSQYSGTFFVIAAIIIAATLLLEKTWLQKIIFRIDNYSVSIIELIPILIF